MQYGRSSASEDVVFPDNSLNSPVQLLESEDVEYLSMDVLEDFFEGNTLCSESSEICV
jgi:hypothetical protein